MLLNRRSFLLRSGMTAAGLVGLGELHEHFNVKASSLRPELASIDSVTIPLRDWSGFTVFGGTASIHAPKSEDEVIRIVEQCRRDNSQCRVVGRRTSWNTKWFGDVNTVMMSTMHLDQLSFDSDAMTVTCGPGVLLETLHREAWIRGMALSTSPAPPWVSIGGAVATGSHGSLERGSLSSSLIGCRLVTGSGSVLVMDENHPDLNAARIALGMLGVMTQLTLQLDPAFRVMLVEQPIATADWESALLTSGPMSFIHASTTGKASTLFKVVPEQASGVLSDEVETGVNADGESYMRGPLPTIVMNFQPPSPAIAGGEWALPVEAFSSVMRVFQSENFSLPSMIWLKKVRGESAFLAAGDDPNKVYVQCGSYYEVAGQQSPEVIATMVKKVERLMLRYGGRPHLSKLIYLTAADLAEVYPGLARFQAIRRRLDPANIFYTQQLANLFG